jgi:hypothetical protein
LRPQSRPDEAFRFAAGLVLESFLFPRHLSSARFPDDLDATVGAAAFELLDAGSSDRAGF